MNVYPFSDKWFPSVPVKRGHRQLRGELADNVTFREFRFRARYLPNRLVNRTAILRTDQSD
jgi:hypothetical protein